jgi:hypothetical protein
MPLQRWTRVIAAAGFSLAVLGSLAAAQAAESNPAADPRATRILRAALQNVAATKSLSFEAEVIREVPLDSGQRVQAISTLRTYVRRPDRLAVIRQGGALGDGNMYYDGKTFALWNQEANAYGTWEAPATLDALIGTMTEKLGFLPPLAAILREDAGSGAKADKVLSADYVGRASLRGVECHQLALTGADVDVQVWVTDGIPVIQRLVVTYKKKPGAPQFTANFLNWDFSAALTDYLFSFVPPPGAAKIEFKVVGKP